MKAGFSHPVFGCALLIPVGSAILPDSFRAINCVVSSFPDVGVGPSKKGFSIWLIAFHLLDDEHVEAVSGRDGVKRGLIFFPILKREKLWTWRLPRHNQHTLIIFTHTAICFEFLHVKCSVHEGLACRFSLQVEHQFVRFRYHGWGGYTPWRFSRGFPFRQVIFTHRQNFCMHKPDMSWHTSRFGKNMWTLRTLSAAFLEPANSAKRMWVLLLKSLHFDRLDLRESPSPIGFRLLVEVCVFFAFVLHRVWTFFSFEKTFSGDC